jgi:hypothetical protein
MYEKCVELDKKIAHYQLLASRFTDQAMLAGVNGLIEQAKTQKAALHPKAASVHCGKRAARGA